MGTATSDDAGVYRIAPDLALVQTIDFFTPVVDDPYDWGRIAAANALSDVYAMGGRPLTALQMIGWPRGTLDFDLAGEVIRGGADVMATAGCTIVGGHSMDDIEPKYGFAVTGEVDPAAVVRNGGGRPGDHLIVTKPLGTGIIATAIKREACPGPVMRAAIDSMTMLNRAASEAMVAVGVNAATDVTGYGLVGHLLEMLAMDGLGATLEMAAVPVLDGVWELLAAGMYPGGSVRNYQVVEPHIESGREEHWKVLADAQTSGGLLMAVAPNRVGELEKALADAGVTGMDIGTVDVEQGLRVV